MARRKRGGEGLVSMASIVGAAMPKGAPPDLATWKLVSWWRGFAGRPLADHVWPARIERGVLTLAADSSAWASEIAFMRETIVAKLAEEMPATKLRSVRTIVATARERPVEGERDAAAAEAPASRKMKMPSAKGLPRELAVALSRVEDTALRNVIARAARVSLASESLEAPSEEVVSEGRGSARRPPDHDHGEGADGSRKASSAQSSSSSPRPDGSSSDG
ncbi:MAG: DUF721 domain-containing protein [Deltaproteobacteria bacterium]|nr:DUF721 domain-containing protein [Deltaproteobacteria bacterium]